MKSSGNSQRLSKVKREKRKRRKRDRAGVVDGI